MCDLINSLAVVKPGCVTVRKSFIALNKTFACALLKNVDGLFTPSASVLKIIGSFYILARVFAAGVSLGVRFDEKIKKVLWVTRIGALSVLFVSVFCLNPNATA